LPSWFETVISIDVKRISAIRFAMLFSLMVAGVLHASSTNLLPGIIYYDGPEKLTGKLVFLVQHDYTVETNGENTASIYEFDLQKKQLCKLTDSPFGRMSVSPDGNLMSVIFWTSRWSIGKDTNLFVYSKISKSIQKTNVESSPQDLFISSDNVVLKLEGYNFPNAGYYLITNGSATEAKLLEYNFDSNQMKVGDFSKEWEDHNSSGDTFKAFDNRYIFFKGFDAPIDGSTLISSPWNFRDYKDADPKNEKTKVLHRFTIFSTSPKTHELLQLSPDCHYALVKSIEPITHRKFSEWPGSTTTFYLVDVATGKIRLLLENKTETSTKSSLWNGFVNWVGAAD
jgi:hypothetical protein